MLEFSTSFKGMDSLTTRPLHLHDAGAVTRLIAAQELNDIGEVVIEEADIIGDWQRPSFDVEANTVGVFAGEDLIAYAEFCGHDRGDAAVRPDYRGRGIGTALAFWMQQRARHAGSTLIGMPVPEGSPSDRLLAELGYHIRWTSWVLALPEDRAIEPQPLPTGYTLRTATEGEYVPVWTVAEDAFLEWSVRERQSFDDFAATVFLRPGFEPWNLRVVMDPAGEVVGVAYVLLVEGTGFVNKLAVRADQRRRGIARALLADAFAQARAHGATRSELSTDSRTGALSLYTRVGMEVTSVWVNRAIKL
jgi:mycothiol synthase